MQSGKFKREREKETVRRERKITFSETFFLRGNKAEMFSSD